MIKGDSYSGWSITASFDILKIKDKMSWKMAVKLTGPTPMKEKEVYDVKFIFGTEDSKGLELFKCGWDRKKESSIGGVFSKQFTPALDYRKAFASSQMVDDFKVNMNWNALVRPNISGPSLSCTAARVLNGPNIPLKLNQTGVKGHFQFKHDKTSGSKPPIEWGITGQFDLSLNEYVPPPPVVIKEEAGLEMYQIIALAGGGTFLLVGVCLILWFCRKRPTVNQHYKQFS